MRIRWFSTVVFPAALLGVVACGPGEFPAKGEVGSPGSGVSALRPSLMGPEETLGGEGEEGPSDVLPTPELATAPVDAAPAAGLGAEDPAEAAPVPVAVSEFSRVLWVAPGGSDTAAGTEAAPFKTVAKALTLLQPGEAVYLKSGTYTERLRLDMRDGAAGRYLTVKAAPGATPVFKGGSGEGKPLLDVQRAYWRVEGLTFDAAGERAFAAFWRGAGAHHGILRGCTLKNGTEGAGVNIAQQASDVLVEANTIYNFQRSGKDSHGVVVQTNSRNVIVRGNDIHHNSGDGVQCLGPEGGATEPGTPFDNLLVEDNSLHENRENGADIKTCTRVTLRGNRIWGHRRTSTSAGEGVVVHLSAKDVTLEDNVVRDNGNGIVIGGVRVGAPPTGIVLRRNLVLDGYNADGSQGIGIRINTAIDVKVHHNTVWNMPTQCLDLGNGESGPSQNVELRNNLMGSCAYMVRVGTQRKSVSFEGDFYYSPAGLASFRIDSKYLGLSGWRSTTGWDSRAVEKTPVFVSIAARDFHLATGSPARNAGVSLGQSYCGSAPDMGAYESDCP